MHDDRPPSPKAEPPRRVGRGRWLLLTLALSLPMLAACKDVQPGSGAATIAKSRAQTSVSGR